MSTKQGAKRESDGKRFCFVGLFYISWKLQFVRADKFSRRSIERSRNNRVTITPALFLSLGEPTWKNI